MTVELIELLMGLYFLGDGVSVTKDTTGWHITFFPWKFLLAVILLLLAFFNGVRLGLLAM